ncbi:DedA family protein [Gordonia sputi]|uniref:DedA family protein n=1 Tax=Gordonia sputi TaxID=36823 RepID=UPI002043E22D|nr:DedA family protein [Gordonia sputi]MCM3896389.1 DedA family protein [Gordonia sputi]
MHSLADWLIDLIRSVPAWAVYLIAGGGVFLETAVIFVGLVMPSEALLLAAGVAAAVGDTNLGVLITVTCVCAIAGDSVGFWFGRVGGPRMMESPLGRRFGEQRWEQARTSLNQSGIWMVAASRWVGYIRTLMPRVAGMTGMQFAKFGVADIVGAVSWVTAVLLAGYFAGAVLGATILLYVVIGLGCCAAIYVLVTYVRRRHAARASDSVDGGVVAAVAGGQPRTDNELDLVKDHERQHDQPDD